MLAKDIFAVNDVDGKIHELIHQLNDLIEERIRITSEAHAMARQRKRGHKSPTVDLSSVDLAIESPTGLSIKSAKKSPI